MKHAPIVLLLALGLLSAGFLVFAGGARAHEEETSVDWVVAYENIRVLGAPVYRLFPNQALPLTGSGTPYTAGSPGLPVNVAYPTITLKTGDYLRIDWSFRYVGAAAVRGDLFWITRLGLDFGTIARYVNGDGRPVDPARDWIGSSSFPLNPGAYYNATLVIRSLQPNFRHLHVGVSVQNVGNIPAAPGPAGVSGNPVLYGVFTDASGAAGFEPLQDVNVANSPFSGTFLMLTPWPWAVASLVGQIVIGLVFIGIMYWYGRWESRKGAKA